MSDDKPFEYVIKITNIETVAMIKKIARVLDMKDGLALQSALVAMEYLVSQLGGRRELIIRDRWSEKVARFPWQDKL